MKTKIGRILAAFTFMIPIWVLTALLIAVFVLILYPIVIADEFIKDGSLKLIP